MESYQMNGTTRQQLIGFLLHMLLMHFYHTKVGLKL